MIKFLLVFIALNGALATILAAMASHQPSLQGQVYLLEIFAKANLQHYVHTLASLLTVLAAYITSQRIWLLSSSIFALGTALFSYPLYLFAFTGAKIAGFLTPIGGMCFILGWLSLLVAAWRLTTPASEKNNE